LGAALNSVARHAGPEGHRAVTRCRNGPAVGSSPLGTPDHRRVIAPSEFSKSGRDQNMNPRIGVALIATKTAVLSADAAPDAISMIAPARGHAEIAALFGGFERKIALLWHLIARLGLWPAASLSQSAAP